MEKQQNTPPDHNNDHSFSDPRTGIEYDAKTKTYLDQKKNAIKNVEYIEAQNMLMAARVASREMGEDAAGYLLNDELEHEQEVKVEDGKFEMNGKTYTIDLPKGITSYAVWNDGFNDGAVLCYDEEHDIIGSLTIDKNGKVTIDPPSETDLSDENQDDGDEWLVNYRAKITGNHIEVYGMEPLKTGEFEVTLKGNKKQKYKIELPGDVTAEFLQEPEGGCNIDLTSVIEGDVDKETSQAGYLWIDEKGKIEVPKSGEDKDLDHFLLKYNIKIDKNSIRIISEEEDSRGVVPLELKNGELEVALKDNKNGKYKIELPDSVRATFRSKQEGGGIIWFYDKNKESKSFYSVLITPTGGLSVSDDSGPGAKKFLTDYQPRYKKNSLQTEIKIEKREK
ncbi:MAG: hypothetical protein AAB373_05085 [Patescibacteria group bacterium]